MTTAATTVGSSMSALPTSMQVGAPGGCCAEELVAANRRLEGCSPQEILAWAVSRYFPRLTMATAFGAEGCCLIHMLAEIESRVRIFNLDTGYQFQETLALRDRIAERYGIVVEYVRAQSSIAEFETANGGPIYNTDPDRCCFERKVLPLRTAVLGYEAWISAIRRDQTAHRKTASIVDLDAKFGLVKVNPLVNWSKADVWKFITDHQVPYNPLHDQGFPSIGCWPCTRSVREGEDERAGRWAGSAKKECGLHTR